VSRRTERVGEQIRAELARLLREEVTDPRLRLVTLTRVDLAPDFRSARVFWSQLQRDAPSEEFPPADPETTAGLASAAGFLRRRLAQALPVKRIPELRFHHDPSMAAGSHTLRLLQELRDGTE